MGRKRSCGFNPTLVRLKLPCFLFFRKNRRFQSHSGSIKTRLRSLQPGGTFGFNPTLVRLKLEKCEEKNRKIFCFNPTLVRLKQKGAISPAPSELCFNPTLVRLKLQNRKRICLQSKLVSIPLWFD